MQRFAFTMKLKPGCAAEYQKRHATIWPELVQLLRAAGVHDYAIFLDEETNLLFAVQKQTGASSQDLGGTAIVQQWWAYMADLMETHPDHSPVTGPLKEVFYLA